MVLLFAGRGSDERRIAIPWLHVPGQIYVSELHSTLGRFGYSPVPPGLDSANHAVLVEIIDKNDFASLSTLSR